MREPTKTDVPRPLSMPSGKNPLGRSIWSGKLSGGAAVAGHGARTKARTATNSTTNLRTTNPRGRPNPLAELSIDYPRAHRQMASRVLDSVGSPRLCHQVPSDALAAMTRDVERRPAGRPTGHHHRQGVGPVR